jgi:hypothetical protein
MRFCQWIYWWKRFFVARECKLIRSVSALIARCQSTTRFDHASMLITVYGSRAKTHFDLVSIAIREGLSATSSGIKKSPTMWKNGFMFVEKLSKRCCIKFQVLYKYLQLRLSLAQTVDHVTE